jgi:hypothetical protein
MLPVSGHIQNAGFVWTVLWVFMAEHQYLLLLGALYGHHDFQQ